MSEHFFAERFKTLLVKKMFAHVLALCFILRLLKRSNHYALKKFKNKVKNRKKVVKKREKLKKNRSILEKHKKHDS